MRRSAAEQATRSNEEEFQYQYGRLFLVFCFLFLCLLAVCCLLFAV
jgi:hypothetical protein